LKHIVYISLVFVFVGVFSNPIFSQKNSYKKKTIQNLDQFEDKLFHFGFSLGVNSSDYLLDADLGTNDSLLIIESNPTLGFNLGIVADLHLGIHFDLRFIPTLSFSQRNLDYTFKTAGNRKSSEFSKPIESTYIDFPLNLKMKSARAGNFSAYTLIGFMYSYDLTAQDKVKNDSANPDDLIVAVNRNTYSYQVGIGLDFYLQYFKFSPEFKLSMGLNNNLVQDGTMFAAPISYLRSRIFLVSFTFEG